MLAFQRAEMNLEENADCEIRLTRKNHFCSTVSRKYELATMGLVAKWKIKIAQVLIRNPISNQIICLKVQGKCNLILWMITEWIRLRQLQMFMVVEVKIKIVARTL
jgi:hypothetical protein